MPKIINNIDEESFDFSTSPNSTLSPKSKHYISNKELYKEFLPYIEKIKEWEETYGREAIDKKPRLPDSIGLAIMTIADKLSSTRNFAGYTYKDEMIGDGIINCVKYVHNFNPDKSKNPFAYITTLIYMAFVQRIQREQRQSYYKNKLTLKQFDNTMQVNSDEIEIDPTAYTDISSKVVKYEESRKSIPTKISKKTKERKLNDLGDFLGQQ